jgi:hypothetical protein
MKNKGQILVKVLIMIELLLISLKCDQKIDSSWK